MAGIQERNGSYRRAAATFDRKVDGLRAVHGHQTGN